MNPYITAQLSADRIHGMRAQAAADQLARDARRARRAHRRSVRPAVAVRRPGLALLYRIAVRSA